MGQAKREGMRWDELVDDAGAIAIKAGSITTDCPHETWIDNGDPEAAYELAKERFAAGELGQFHSQEEVEEAMKQALDLAGEECGACRKNAESD